jgi:Protein of unknown function (DUF2637)
MAASLARIRTAAQDISVSKTLAASRDIAAWALTVLIFLATLDSFAQSYRGLWEFARHYLMIPEPFDAAWPLIVDVFLAIGEIRLFISAVDGDDPKRLRAWFWILTGVGLAVSVAGNVAHEGFNVHWYVMVGNAVPPVAAGASLGAGLGLAKKSAARAVAQRRAEEEREAALLAAERLKAARPPETETALPPRRAVRRSARNVRTFASQAQLTAATEGIERDLRAGVKLNRRRAADKYGITPYRADMTIKLVQAQMEKEATSG